MNRLISWPGCKYRQLADILSYVPDRNWQAICEPVLGAGAFSFSFAGMGAELYWAESNEPLANWWDWLLREPDYFVQAMSEVRHKYEQAKVDRDVFNALRDGFNELNRTVPRDAETGAMFWVLVYSSMNNLARFNLSGQYNQSWGKGRNVPDPHSVFTSDVIADLDWARYKNRGCCDDDFRTALDRFIIQARYASGNAIAYLDPPYILELDSYPSGTWTERDEYDLINWMYRLDEAAIPWLATNYLSKGDKVHPYADRLQDWRTYPLNRKLDARPTAQSLPAEEVVIIGEQMPPPKQMQMAMDL